MPSPSQPDHSYVNPQQIPDALKQYFASFLSDPDNIPDEFKTWLLQYIETFPPQIPFSQLIGYSFSTATVLASNSASQTINNATLATVTFDQTQFDSSSMHSNSTNNSRLTCRNPGKYLVGAYHNLAPHADSSTRYFDINKNGITLTALRFPAINSDVAQATPVTIASLAAGDYVETRVYQSSGVALSLSAGSLFWAVRVAP